MKGANISKRINNAKGSTNLIIACTCLIVIIIGSAVSDIGYGQLQYMMLQHDAKQIVKDGAIELIKNQGDTRNLVKTRSLRKVADLNQLDIAISDSNREITLRIGKPYMYSMLKVIGIKKRQLETVKTAKIFNITSYRGIRPFAIKKQSLVYGKECFLTNSQTGTAGSVRYVGLNLGNSDLEKNIMNGYTGKVSVGNRLVFQPVDPVKARNAFQKLLTKGRSENENTNSAYESNCPGIIVIPVVENIFYSEQKPMKVIGFTSFYVESSSLREGNTVLKGRFIKNVANGSGSDGTEDFGLYSIDIMDRE